MEVRIANQVEFKRNHDELKRLNRTDPLTGLSNRRHLDEVIRIQQAAMSQAESHLSLIMIDIDHFKNYNNHYGHNAGDECLRHVAHLLGVNVNRVTDFVARFVGEEFMVFLPATDSTGAETMAWQLQQALAKKEIHHEASEAAFHVTFSMDIASLSPSDKRNSIEKLIEYADIAFTALKKKAVIYTTSGVRIRTNAIELGKLSLIPELDFV